MLRRIILFLTPFLVLMILFLLIVLFINRDKGKGAFQISSNQSAQVYMDGKYVGKTPLCLCQLPQLIKTGDYDVKLVPLDTSFSSNEQKVTIYQGVLSVLDISFNKNTSALSKSLITLESIDDKKDSEILVVSFPDKAQVYLDSNLSGTTPLLLRSITPSDHEIKILKDGYEAKDLKIKTVAGKRLDATVTLGIKADLSSTPTTVSSSSATPAPSKILILSTPTGFLRVRSDPSAAASQVGTVSPGNLLPMLSEQTGWYKIELPNGSSGWVSSDYAKKQ